MLGELHKLPHFFMFVVAQHPDDNDATSRCATLNEKQWVRAGPCASIAYHRAALSHNLQKKMRREIRLGNLELQPEATRITTTSTTHRHNENVRRLLLRPADLPWKGTLLLEFLMIAKKWVGKRHGLEGQLRSGDTVCGDDDDDSINETLFND